MILLRENKQRINLSLDIITSFYNCQTLKALRNIRKMYETPTSRAYEGIAGMMDKLAIFMKTSTITTGRDGNMSAIIQAAKNYDQIRQSFKGAYKDLQEEQQSHIRGNKNVGYDQ